MNNKIVAVGRVTGVFTVMSRPKDYFDNLTAAGSNLVELFTKISGKSIIASFGFRAYRAI